MAARFYRWQKAGIWNQILAHLQAMPAAGYAYADLQGRLDWEVHYVDGTVIRAHDSRRRWNIGAMNTKN
ncbi:hypothetical protein [Nostoc sp. CHAB 5715]|uniref:hypothetical protein n=1 Tax=Nostoc sp. CHAB 5715 TaxID=2780400 RepID=UPI001E3053AE|nr:hypothetical protein [Nostoc sp. CHAB 5715]MCC5623579.1 hypothetical protein [Nostoc sp. CHAB 5715]